MSALDEMTIAAVPAEAPRRLRIAFVVHDYNRHGGHARYVAELATRFRREHEIHVYSNTFEEPDPSGIVYHHIPAWRANALTTILSFILPATLLTRGNYDIVHAQGLCGLKQDISTAHMCQAGWFTAKRQQGQKLSWRERIFEWTVTGLERRALSSAKARYVIAVSSSTRDDLQQYYHRHDNLRVIHHGVDTELFHPRHRIEHRQALRDKLGIRPETPLALFVGNALKGAHVAVEAVAKVPGLHLLIVTGSRTDDIQAAIERTQTADRVHLHPHSTQVERIYAAADVFLFPTIYDPFGLVILEAMSSGLPVITSRIAGASELITPGVHGFVTQNAWDVEQLAQHLQTLAANRGLCEQMGAAARTQAEQFTWDRAARQTMAVYQEFLAQKSQ